MRLLLKVLRFPPMVCFMLSCPNCQVRFRLEMRPPISAGDFDGHPLQAVVNQVLAAKSAAMRDPDYVKSLKHYLTTFAAGWEHRFIETITAADIEARLAELSQGQSDSSRQTWFTRTNTLFSFASRRGFISINPLSQLERIAVNGKAPVILTPAQAVALVKATPERFLGFWS